MHSTLQWTSHIIRCGKGNERTLNESLKVFCCYYFDFVFFFLCVCDSLLCFVVIFEFAQKSMCAERGARSEEPRVYTIPYDLFLL